MAATANLAAVSVDRLVRRLFGQRWLERRGVLVDDDDFDAIHARIVERGLTYWADPYRQQGGRINTNDGGRGLYWNDPDGHLLEIITVPYGGN